MKPKRYIKNILKISAIVIVISTLVATVMLFASFISQKAFRRQTPTSFRNFTYNGDQYTFLESHSFSSNQDERAVFELINGDTRIGYVTVDSKIGNVEDALSSYDSYKPSKVGDIKGYYVHKDVQGEGRIIPTDSFIFQRESRTFTVTYMVYGNDFFFQRDPFLWYSLHDSVSNISFASLKDSGTDDVKHYSSPDLSFDVLSPFYLEYYSYYKYSGSSFQIKGSGGFENIGSLTIDVKRQNLPKLDPTGWESFDYKGYPAYKNGDNGDIYIDLTSKHVHIYAAQPTKYAIENTRMYKSLLDSLRF